MNNVKDFGAVGDGITLDTRAIQRAIDVGGMVYFPEGTYLSGTIYLKSHGGIYLDKGAVIKASHNADDYNAPDFCPQNQVWEEEFMAGTHLIAAVEQCDISICGQGAVDGDSHYWVNESSKHKTYGFYDQPARGDRPAQMIYFAECSDIHITDVSLRNAPFWHLFLYGCTDAVIRGLHITGERKQWVNDGIDLDCCSRVTVSDCIIDTGDDGITLRASGATLVSKDAVCEDVVVTNCIITSYLDYGIRIGVGNGLIRNCLFSNIIIKNSLNGIGFTGRFAEYEDCTSVENLRFSNISVDALLALDFKISSSQDLPPLKAPAYARGITFADSYFKTQRCCNVVGFEDTYYSDISFLNSEFVYIRENPDNDRFMCAWAKEHEGAVIYIKKSENITFSACRFVCNDSDSGLENDIYTENPDCLRLLNTKCHVGVAG